MCSLPGQHVTGNVQKRQCPLEIICPWFGWESCCIFTIQRGTMSLMFQLRGLSQAQEPLAIWNQHYIISYLIRGYQKYIWKHRTPLCEHCYPVRLGFNSPSRVKATSWPAQLTSHNDVGGLFRRISNVVVGDATVGASIFCCDGRDG